ncbi:28.6 kDa protein [Human adenovirus 1]|nr:28.6 kDa protein [Human adenovirus 1]WOZ24079.1 28.6 kDa protein [Human adenovirus 1]WOZ24115.1 28.6 kDa protein [Human adenovirus 1]WOZ24599.1 28.6 kDa protein [Human adenovirus 1]
MAAAVEALYVVLEREGAVLPRQEGFSGVYVFFSPINFVIPPMGAVMLSLRLRVCIPPGYFGRFLALTDVNQPDVFTESYIMTPDMTEELSVVLFNHGDQFFYGHAGMAVVRLMLIRVVFPVEPADMFERKMVSFSVVVPELTCLYLHEHDYDVLAFLREALPDFLSSTLHFISPPMQQAYIGATLVSIAPSMRVIISVGSFVMVPGGEVAALVRADLHDYVQLALRRDLRDRGIFVNVPLLNLIQVCEEPEFLQS